MERLKDRQPLFDLHCDTLTLCHAKGMGLCNPVSQLSLDKVPGDVALCQCMAVFVPDKLRGEAAAEYFRQVHRFYREQLACNSRLLHEAEAGQDPLEVLAACQTAAMLTVEGGAVLAGRLSMLEELHVCGVRMMTLTWNGANEICGGCASGEGFTPFGRQVVTRMEELGIAVDVSHLSDQGFWELCGMATRPFAASHSNARSVCGHRRNLTDEMFREIVQRGGVVGLNYYPPFLCDSGESHCVEDLLRHLHHFLDLGGEDAVALGSDFDGADMPPYLPNVSAVAKLRGWVEGSGVPSPVADKLLFRNAQRFFAGLYPGRPNHQTFV